MKRSLFLASSLTALTGCGAAGNALNDSPVRNWLLAVEPLNHALIGTRGMAKLYPKSAIDWNFRLNGFDTPNSAAYQAMVHDGWSSYRLAVDGLVEHPQAFTVPQLRAMKSLTQITRHDCVEGWSVVGEWGGVPLGMLLGVVKPKPSARYVVFYSMDHDPNGTPYYESLSVVEAAHPQTLLALDLNGKPLDPAHGAPVRLRVPTQLGYKSAKWVRGIRLAASFADIYGGGGGYWEDNGYEWYAGI